MKLCENVVKLVEDCKKAGLRCFVTDNKHDTDNIILFFVSDGKNVLFINILTNGDYFSLKVAFCYPAKNYLAAGCLVYDTESWNGWKDFDAEFLKSFMHTPDFSVYNMLDTPKLYNDVEEFISDRKKLFGDQFVEL